MTTVITETTRKPILWWKALTWVACAVLVLLGAIWSRQVWYLNFVHVFFGILWTGTDIFMGFILGPIMRRVDLATRRTIISLLMPRMLLYMPVVSAVTSTAGLTMAQWMGLFNLPYPQRYWLDAALVIGVILTVQGLAFLLPTNLRVYFELQKPMPDLQKIQRLMGWYVKVVASQALMQVAIIVVMARIRSGM